MRADTTCLHPPHLNILKLFNCQQQIDLQASPDSQCLALRLGPLLSAEKLTYCVRVICPVSFFIDFTNRHFFWFTPPVELVQTYFC